MPKFIITQTDRYEIEADSMEEAQADYKMNLVDGSLDDYDFIDGSTTYEEIEANVDDYGCCPFCQKEDN